MHQFVLRQGCSGELQLFPHIIELGIKKNSCIQLNSLQESTTDSLRIYCITDGKFEWLINHQQHLLYPGDVALILPGHTFASEKGFLEIGSLIWIEITINNWKVVTRFRANGVVCRRAKAWLSGKFYC